MCLLFKNQYISCSDQNLNYARTKISIFLCKGNVVFNNYANYYLLVIQCLYYCTAYNFQYFKHSLVYLCKQNKWSNHLFNDKVIEITFIIMLLRSKLCNLFRIDLNHSCPI